MLLIISNYNNEHLTKTKLQKLLYFCDFECYRLTGQSITDSKYVKNHYGPMIGQLDEILATLNEEGCLEIRQVQHKHGTGYRTKFFSQVDDLDAIKQNLTDLEQSIIQTQNRRFEDYTTEQIKEFSHHDFPYLATEKKEIIDYELVHYRDDAEPDEEDYSDLAKNQKLIDTISDL